MMAYINLGRPNPHFKPDQQVFDPAAGKYRKVSTGHHLRNWNGSLRIEESAFVAAVCGRHDMQYAGFGFTEDIAHTRFEVWRCPQCRVEEHRF
jgi:hypothetical protein